VKASDVMTRRVISISPTATILEAIKLMLKHHVSGLPVIDRKGKLVGVVTESDFLRRSELGTERARSRWLVALFGPGEAARDYVHSHGLKVQDVMTRDPVVIAEDTALDQIVDVMERRNVKRLPVMHRGRVVGIVSRANLILALASIHRTVPTSQQNDAAIRDRILTSIHEQSWASGASVDVILHNGIADIWGTISDVAQRQALKALVESTPGVRRVEDHLTWQGKPASGT
jgi:CBS domain-containing protein